MLFQNQKKLMLDRKCFRKSKQLVVFLMECHGFFAIGQLSMKAPLCPDIQTLGNLAFTLECDRIRACRESSPTIVQKEKIAAQTHESRNPMAFGGDILLSWVVQAPAARAACLQ